CAAPTFGRGMLSVRVKHIRPKVGATQTFRRLDPPSKLNHRSIFDLRLGDFRRTRYVLHISDPELARHGVKDESLIAFGGQLEPTSSGGAAIEPPAKCQANNDEDEQQITKRELFHLPLLSIVSLKG